MSVWLELEHASAGESRPLGTVLDAVSWNADGLIAAIAQQHDTGQVLMLAWMNRAALDETLSSGQVCYWSRSRRQLWRKGETSGHRQRLVQARLDCDGDAVLLLVDQHGSACHTGRLSCFYNAVGHDRVTVLDIRGETTDTPYFAQAEVATDEPAIGTPLRLIT